MKVRWGKGKFLHRRVCAGYLPAEVLRRKKRGFAVNVVDDWFRSAMSSRLPDTLRDPQSRIYSLLRQPAVLPLLEEHMAGRRDHHKLLFSLVMAEHWMRAFV